MERLADVRIPTDEVDDDVFVLAAGRAWLDLHLPEHAHADSKTPLVLTASEEGRLELIDFIRGAAIPPGHQIVCCLYRGSDHLHIAMRLRDHFQARRSS
ncbi:hypothetical protein N799_09890 [Lysobacter arseniciresistens ZS79]|uniref:Uncharacterized protein n=1 Tax=Lysobacter arseniciresistens ZS79 TaxID=913325 RepID=A0A0A0EYG6_9GAMM|nr:hypothetical protein N799_09890 [Lysobacter arseniciresistens ZS79]